jgi:mono/diheme cytochrome c family protein
LKTKKNRGNSELGTQNLELRTGRPRFGVLSSGFLVLSFLALSACRQDMHQAPRYDPLEESAVLPKGSAAQPIVEGTVPRGHLNDDDLMYTGKIDGKPADEFPMAITAADLDRGEQRYNIYCSPCHGRTGEGNGMVVQRGYKQAANYHIDRLRAMPVGYFFDVMTNGFGSMPDYKSQIPVADRWRIVAYIRALQLSHHSTANDVPADEMKRMTEGAPAPAAGKSGGER